MNFLRKSHRNYMSQKFENQKVTRILSRDFLEKKNLSKNMLN